MSYTRPLFLIAISITTIFVHGLPPNSAFKMASDIQDGANCTKAGFVCVGCSASWNCYQLPNGTWIKELAENCTNSGMTCLKSTGICTSDFNPDCTIEPEYVFECSQPGVFPDPFDCQTYHVCSPNGEDHPVYCQEGFSYDPLTMGCTKKLIDECQLPIPRCTGPGQDAILANPRMYYQCRTIITDENERIFVPRLFNCPPDHKFIGGRCHDINDDVVDEVCLVSGNFYRPTCDDYHFCNRVNSTVVDESCPSDHYFNYLQGVCRDFNCNSLFV